MTIRHATPSGYRDDGCRCDLCKKAITYEHNIYKIRRMANGGPLLLPKLGTVRRLQALMALGWPRRELARQAGYTGDVFALYLNGNRTHVTEATHKTVSDLFDRLCMTPGPSSSGAMRAKKKNWPPPLAWDDIDNDEFPNLHAEEADNEVDEAILIRFMAGDYDVAASATKAEKDAIVYAWRKTGRNLRELERATGWAAHRYGASA